MQTKEQKAAKQKVHYAANREKILTRQKAYAAANPEKISAKNRAYYAANPEKMSAKNRAYYAAHREQAAAYYAANHNEYLACWHKQRAKSFKAKIGEEKAIVAWLNSWKTEAPVACHYCKKVSTGTGMTMDHVIPLSAGGDHDLPNLVVCCLSCNCSKKDKLPEVWVAQLA